MVITTSPLVKTYTLQEFWDLPEPKDRSKMELIKGVLYMSPPPEEIHDDVAAMLIGQIRDAIRDHGYNGRIYAPRAAIWIDDTYLEPDLMYLSDELRRSMPPKHRTSADLVVEITSPSSERYDRTTKADTYQAMRVREMWLVDPDKQTVEVRYFSAGASTVFASGDVVESRVLPEIDLPVSAIFVR
ncbi:MAG: hypothetical protein DMG13_29470 [Acidobacteria bacterium]|nr:MAG: hypothetical protein DMG13_29470 [Acidobacteriota bacterium]